MEGTDGGSRRGNNCYIPPTGVQGEEEEESQINHLVYDFYT